MKSLTQNQIESIRTMWNLTVDSDYAVVRDGIVRRDDDIFFKTDKGPKKTAVTSVWSDLWLNPNKYQMRLPTFTTLITYTDED